MEKNDKTSKAPDPVQADSKMRRSQSPISRMRSSWYLLSPVQKLKRRGICNTAAGSYNVTFQRSPFPPDPAIASGAASSLHQEADSSRYQWRMKEGCRSGANKGVAAFVLKYRLNQTPEDIPGFERAMTEMFTATASRPPRPEPEEMKEQLTAQLEDSSAAFALIRSRAAEWNIDPERIGMVGFSAGAALTIATALFAETAKPAFLGDIYGPLTLKAVPKNAPPLFVALAADDPFFANSGYELIDNWRAAGMPVEFHLYEQGGHGFGMYPKTTTSTGWFTAFISWLTMHGMVITKK